MMIQPPDDDERTNSMGLFNTAEAFRLSAMALEDEKVKIGHAASPIRICYYHALELYLKALLRQKHSVKKIKGNFGHNTKRLVEEAEALGLVVTDEDREVFSKADTDAIIEARYIRTGAKNWPERATAHLQARAGWCRRSPVYTALRCWREELPK
jgi:HEPN domain-containing protein